MYVFSCLKLVTNENIKKTKKCLFCGIYFFLPLQSISYLHIDRMKFPNISIINLSFSMTRFFKMWNTFICISKCKIIFIISTYRNSGTSTTTEPALLCRTTWQNYSLHPQNGNKSLNRQHSFLIRFFRRGNSNNYLLYWNGLLIFYKNILFILNRHFDWLHFGNILNFKNISDWRWSKK